MAYTSLYSVIEQALKGIPFVKVEDPRVLIQGTDAFLDGNLDSWGIIWVSQRAGTDLRDTQQELAGDAKIGNTANPFHYQSLEFALSEALSGQLLVYRRQVQSNQNNAGSYKANKPRYEVVFVAQRTRS